MVALTVNRLFKKKFYYFKKFIVVNIFKVLGPFWDKKIDFIIIVDIANCYNKLHLPFLYCGRSASTKLL